MKRALIETGLTALQGFCEDKGLNQAEILTLWLQLPDVDTTIEKKLQEARKKADEIVAQAVQDAQGKALKEEKAGNEEADASADEGANKADLVAAALEWIYSKKAPCLFHFYAYNSKNH